MLHVALLRAVNLGPHNKVAMSDLRELLQVIGFAEPRSLLQSGNLVFDSGRQAGARLERLLETETERRLGLRTDFMVRTAKEWKALIAANPFPDAAENDPGHLLVVFCKDAVRPASVAQLQAGITGRERVAAEGRQAYINYPDGIGTSRVTNAVIEKKLGTRGTGRNWNTVLKLSTLLCVMLLLLPVAPGRAQSSPPRWQLAAAFVKRDSAALRRYLAPDVMIWPPAPDTARRGTAAIAYFVRLALGSRVAQSEFRPNRVNTDGLYLVEDGTWSFTHRRGKVRARYDLRWRQVNGRWLVSFLKWDLFR